MRTTDEFARQILWGGNSNKTKPLSPSLLCLTKFPRNWHNNFDEINLQSFIFSVSGFKVYILVHNWDNAPLKLRHYGALQTRLLL